MAANVPRWGLRGLSLCLRNKGRVCLPRRLYSVIHEPRFETVAVKSGSSGYVTMDIHNPQNTSPESPIILYIPPLPLLGSSQHPLPPPALLSPSNTVITLRPRWSQAHSFPIPLHDLLALYNHILDRMVPPAPQPARPIAIYSSSITASLATSLALTECRPGQRGLVSALAIKDPILDWTDIATTLPPSNTHASVMDLYSQRSTLFSRPESCFDIFASPVLFFRTSGMHTPTKWAAAPSEEEVLAAFDAAQMGGRRVQEEVDLFPPPRKSHLKFPAKGSGLKIPWVRMGITGGAEIELPSTKKGRKGKKAKEGGEEVTLREMMLGQVEEMAHLMRRSVAMHEMKDKDEDGDAEAARRVSLVAVAEEDDNAEWAAEFFRDVL